MLLTRRELLRCHRELFPAQIGIQECKTQHIQAIQPVCCRVQILHVLICRPLPAWCLAKQNDEYKYLIRCRGLRKTRPFI